MIGRKALLFFKFEMLQNSGKNTLLKAKNSHKKNGESIAECNFHRFGRLTGLEPATFGTTIRRSNQLSYSLRALKDCKGKIKPSNFPNIFSGFIVLIFASLYQLK
jgi:hypothetical protein